MFDNIHIRWESFASRKTIRKWVVSEVRYDFDYDGYCTHKLEGNEYCEFGTPFAAYKHAEAIFRRYRKIYSDVEVIIKEVGVTEKDLQV